MIGPFSARMGQRLTPSGERLYADGDTVVAQFEAEGVASDGKPYANNYAWFMHLKEGKITVHVSRATCGAAMSRINHSFSV